MLRKSIRVKTVQGTVAIEGNTLTEDQITAMMDGNRVIGPRREIREVQNTLAAYDQLGEWQPQRRTDLLAAHRVLMEGLLERAGEWRRGAVGVLQGQQVVHVAPPADRVASLVQQVLDFLKEDSQTHSLIQAAVIHYELEFIHPFDDGNGRIGRLWHSLILSRYHPVFHHVPIESVIRDRQAEYYQVLGECDQAGSSTRFIEFALTATRDALSSTLNQITPESITGVHRIETARAHFGKVEFSRKDYLVLFPKLSAPTASRDLKQAVDQSLLRKRGDKSQTRYAFRSN